MGNERAHKGNYAEMRVMADCARRGYTVSVPFGHDSRYDLIIDRRTELIRTQVKHVKIVRNSILIKCTSSPGSASSRRGALYAYLTDQIDMIAAYEPETDRVYYVPMSEVRNNTRAVSLHLSNETQQKKGIRFCGNYTEI